MVRKKRLRDHGGYSVAPARFQVSVIRQLPGTVLEKAAERLWLHPIFTCQLDKIRRKTSSGLLLVPLFCRRTAARRKGKTSLIPADKRGFFVGARRGLESSSKPPGAASSASPQTGGYFDLRRSPARRKCKESSPGDYCSAPPFPAGFKPYAYLFSLPDLTNGKTCAITCQTQQRKKGLVE